MQMHLINAIEKKCCFLNANINLEARLVVIISKNAASFLYLEFLFTCKLITASSVFISEIIYLVAVQVY